MPVNETLQPGLKIKQTQVFWIFQNTFCGTTGKTDLLIQSKQERREKINVIECNEVPLIGQNTTEIQADKAVGNGTYFDKVYFYAVKLIDFTVFF